MADILTNVEASLLRYLHEQLKVPHGIEILEDLTSQDFTSFAKWVVIDSLSNRIGPEPKQLFFLHAALHKDAPNAKEELTRLVGMLTALFEVGQEIVLYDYDSAEQVGVMTVSNAALSPVLQHKGGGAMRSLSIGLAYPAL